MDNFQLNLKWAELSKSQTNNGFRSLRISSECLSDLFIGINKEANRCLILAIPEENKLNFKGVIKENLTIEYFSETNFIVLQLTDNTFYDLFDDLIISLYHRIKDIFIVDDYSKEFINTFHKWSEFFDDKKSDLLSEAIIKGLFGELLVLKSLIEESNSRKINEVLNSWKGPYDKGHDFELNAKDIEVKTKDFSQIDIKISSEFQLECDLNKYLELFVVSVENVDNEGASIRDLVLEIKHTINEMLGDCTILLNAIKQKGLILKNLYLYDNFRYKHVNTVIYDCNSPDFPKLIKSNIPIEINAVKYNIRLSSLTRFILSKKEY